MCQQLRTFGGFISNSHGSTGNGDIINFSVIFINDRFSICIFEDCIGCISNGCFIGSAVIFIGFIALGIHFMGDCASIVSRGDRIYSIFIGFAAAGYRI